MLLLWLVDQSALFPIVSFVSGVSANAIQFPYTSLLVAGTHQGRAIGRLVSNVMLGIMLARPASSFIAKVLPWRRMYLIAAMASSSTWPLSPAISFIASTLTAPASFIDRSDFTVAAKIGFSHPEMEAAQVTAADVTAIDFLLRPTAGRPTSHSEALPASPQSMFRRAGSSSVPSLALRRSKEGRASGCTSHVTSE